ncbi:hypothetical protein, partial [Bacillus sp. NPDC094077]|uniref:hypothetical protein n=1 Tax=Bacillus sp. NPDC094077 TaxID=3390932 RepID=UPI003D0544A4
NKRHPLVFKLTKQLLTEVGIMKIKKIYVILTTAIMLSGISLSENITSTDTTQNVAAQTSIEDIPTFYSDIHPGAD